MNKPSAGIFKKCSLEGAIISNFACTARSAFAYLDTLKMAPKPVIVVLLSALLCAKFESALAQSPEQPTSVERAMKFESEGKLLAAISVLQNDSEPNPVHQQLLGLFYSYVGDWKKTQDLRPEMQKKNRFVFQPEFVAVPAMEAIIERAKQTNIVIVNEAHDSPHHRLFISQLLEELKGLGYSYHAMETLSEPPESLMNRGYPIRTTGFYAVEPMFGELIRNSLRYGYTPVSYESADEEQRAAETLDPIDGINAREFRQCENLMKHVFANNRNAKIVVHVGHDHVMERPRDARDKQIQWLAYRLKTATGVDPLTIDQTTDVQSPSDVKEKAVIVLDSNGVPVTQGHFKDFVDIQVLHPPCTDLDGRPDWLSRDKARLFVSVPLYGPVGSKPILAQAFLENETVDAIPLDQVIVPVGDREFKLLLKPANYRLVLQDETGNQRSVARLVVEKSPENTRLARSRVESITNKK